jgi:hypothetical protein
MPVSVLVATPLIEVAFKNRESLPSATVELVVPVGMSEIVNVGLAALPTT